MGYEFYLHAQKAWCITFPRTNSNILVFVFLKNNFDTRALEYNFKRWISYLFSIHREVRASSKFEIDKMLNYIVTWSLYVQHNNHSYRISFYEWPISNVVLTSKISQYNRIQYITEMATYGLSAEGVYRI